jgi:hypothetical protein
LLREPVQRPVNRVVEQAARTHVRVGKFDDVAVLVFERKEFK